MKTIPLTKGYFAKVDDEDYEKTSILRWYAGVLKDSKGKIKYVRAIRTNRKSQGVRRTLQMARFILNAPENKYVDHINGDTLDNRKSNLRLCTHAENLRNQKRGGFKKGTYKGVRSCGKKWATYITINKKHIYLGIFKTKKEAALAYNEASVKYFGKFAKLNIIN